MALLPESGVGLSATSHDTALCLIPPQHLWSPIDRLRSLYDKAYGIWPPHINLVYPFVRPEVLAEAAEILCKLDLQQQCPREVTLQHADTFIHKRHNTMYLRPASKGGEGDTVKLTGLGRTLCRALGRSAPDDGFQHHMTIAQSQDVLSDSHSFLLDKARLLTPITWKIGQLAILIREEAQHGSDKPRQMRLWGYIDIEAGQLSRPAPTADFYGHLMPTLDLAPGAIPTAGLKTNPEATFKFDQPSRCWQPMSPSSPLLKPDQAPDRLIVASYNVLAEFEWPPSSVRYPLLIANILSSRASADILVLQEVTDHFLPFLMADEDIRSRYPFSSHACPEQQSNGPLPSLLNIVVMSRFPFAWGQLPSQRKHKAFAVATFPTLSFRASAESDPLPLVLAACHLTQGLVDGAIVAKKNELQRLLNHLSATFPRHPSVIAGDFNLATSSLTIELAHRKQAVSSHGHQYLCDIDTMLLEAGFQDAWLATRVESGESSGALTIPQIPNEIHEGEQGATFDPLVNALAVGPGSNNRPQRYDRILVNDSLPFRPRGFNIFGQDTTKSDSGPAFASDHWGVRCLLLPSPSSEGAADQVAQPKHLDMCKAPASLGGLDELKECLTSHGCLPNESDDAARKEALYLLEQVLVGASGSTSSSSDGRTRLNVVLIPVGSYALGVWTASSDVDCLCVGGISSRTFFALALQRLRRASSTGITVLRRVKASSGTMLELDIRGIKFDLQYCAAASIADRWPEVMMRPSSDPAFALPLQALSKLKPARDLYYLRRSIPDMAQYRLAHILIKAWAKSRGLYASKFGLLGGIHISAMLVPVCKILAHDGSMPSTMDIIVTFFHHYAQFDWKQDMVFDPFFHKSVKYRRSFREPLCLLGWHAPVLNTAVNASYPTVKILVSEFARISALLSQDTVNWDQLLGPKEAGTQPGAGIRGAEEEFRRAFDSYVKIDAHYWGSSPTKGNKFLGWLESRCIKVLVDIDRKIPELSARIWPARFVEESSAGDDQGNPEYHACYLVGLEWQSARDTSASRVEGSVAKGALQAILQAFEALIRGDEKYYDPRSCWMSASLARRSSISNLHLDQRQWGHADVGASDSEDDLSMDEEESEEEDADGEQAAPGSSASSAKAPHKKKAVSHAKQRPTTGRFRTALDVMNRLRWDANMDAGDYIVGYEDRFVGARERPLEQWKSEQTDEEFIPQHRILYFKRKSDGSIVWERRTRIDQVFGSGVKADDGSAVVNASTSTGTAQ